MKTSVTLLALLCAVPAFSADRPLYAFETQRSVAPFRDAPVSKSACEAQMRAFALDEARFARATGEPMEARCVPVND